ncbi:hypothetical protein, partial [Escherichia coli]|uniref:hypothetical protein n=1 Tax=Escherichia coli TaxID=562 RepID=UPI003CCBCD61
MLLNPDSLCRDTAPGIFSELTMSNNLQDILAAASGYQSVTSEPALNRKRPKEGANKRGNSSRLTQSFHFF